MIMNPPTSLIEVVGLDPSLRNWGVCVAQYDINTKELSIKSLDTICIKPNTHKTIRQNIKDLDSAYGIFQATELLVKDAVAVFAEVPVGSQSARSMASYGICVGILGSLQARGIPIHVVTPKEVKLAAIGKEAMSKQEMIDWATSKFPNAPWPTYTNKGVTSITNGKAEHMADALAAIYAGVNSKEFLSTLKLIQSLGIKTNAY